MLGGVAGAALCCTALSQAVKGAGAAAIQPCFHKGITKTKKYVLYLVTYINQNAG